MTNVCPTHGPHTGLQFVDGIDLRTGKHFGRSETFCEPCRDEEARRRFPYRDDPTIQSLREGRKALNLTQRELGALLGLHPAQVSQIEQGIAPPDSPEVQDYLAVLRGDAR